MEKLPDIPETTGPLYPEVPEKKYRRKTDVKTRKIEKEVMKMGEFVPVGENWIPQEE